MANLNQSPSHVASIGYNGFPMDARLEFSSTVGELLPVYYDFLDPGDKVDLSTEIKTRTMEIESSAMTKLTEHIDWFFVPMTRLYKLFPEFYYGVNDNHTSFVDTSKISKQYPLASLLDVLNNISTFAGKSSSAVDYADYFTSMPKSVGALRLLDCLGFPVKQFIESGLLSVNRSNPAEARNMMVNLHFLQAYQCIYMDKFRLSDRENNDADTYNVDKYYQTGEIPYDTISKMLTLRFAPWSKDFYTDTYVSPLFGDGSPNSIESYDYTAVNQWLTSTFDYKLLSPSINQSVDGDGSAVGLPAGASANPFYAVNTANIRSLFAVEKLLEITRRAGKHYDKQTLAHFGVDVPMGLDNEAYYIGGSTSDIQIGDVIATAGTDTTPLGKVGGKGYGYGKSHNLKFEAKSHGILMAIYHCTPVADYEQTGFDKLNLYTKREDYFIPEFDNLGLQPQFKYQTYWSFDATENSQILGWQYRYYELKRKFNRVIGGLAGSLSYWTTSKYPLGDNTLASYLIEPNYLDNVMLAKFHPVAELTQDSDDDEEVDPSPDDNLTIGYMTSANGYDYLVGHDTTTNQTYPIVIGDSSPFDVVEYSASIVGQSFSASVAPSRTIVDGLSQYYSADTFDGVTITNTNYGTSELYLEEDEVLEQGLLFIKDSYSGFPVLCYKDGEEISKVINDNQSDAYVISDSVDETSLTVTELTSNGIKINGQSLGYGLSGTVYNPTDGTLAYNSPLIIIPATVPIANYTLNFQVEE